MNMTRKKQHQPAQTPPDGPAVIGPHHVQDRILSPVAGALKGWRNLSPLERASRKGQLRGGSSRYTEHQRFEAGMNYAQTFRVAAGAGTTDSTQRLDVSKSSRGFEPPQSVEDAERILSFLDKAMGARDRDIVRRVCGGGHEPVSAIKAVCADYEHTVAARFREALDSLIEAFDLHRRVGQARRMAS